MNIPAGKTAARLNNNPYQAVMRKGDEGYVDGYVQGMDTRPYAVFVRTSDGAVDLVPTHMLTAHNDSLSGPNARRREGRDGGESYKGRHEAS